MGGRAGGLRFSALLLAVFWRGFISLFIVSSFFAGYKCTTGKMRRKRVGFVIVKRKEWSGVRSCSCGTVAYAERSHACTEEH